jgi:protocatechuate 3,4-dioxygenase beta subunit
LEQSPSATSENTKFTPPPGKETDAVEKLIDRAKISLESGQSTTSILTDPAFLSVHEWPRFRQLIRESAQGSPLTIVTREEPGQALVVTGHVIDSAGRSIKNAAMYVYQTSAKGWYSDRAAHISGNEGDRKHARLFGYLTTDEEGHFELRTVRPNGYPNSDLPSHIHVEIEGQDKQAGNLTTEIQFDDDPRLTVRWRQRSQQEGFVIGKVEKDPDGPHRVEIELKLR